MKRSIESGLLKWKDSPGRKPLILRGMRQTGKTYTLKEFGRSHYPDHAYFNFESDGRLRDVFEKDLDPHRIVRELSVIRNKAITEDTLIIFDEIQFCYPAITSLKYFCEDAPEYHVASAGSFLGLKLSESRRAGDGMYSFPVGKVDFLRMSPMGFEEFVLARGGDLLFGFISDLRPFDEIPQSIAAALERLYLEYLCVGGMPEAVSEWIGTENIDRTSAVQRRILDSFEADLAKYSSERFERISRVWNSVAVQAAEDGGRFRLKEAGGTGATLSGSIEWLLAADLVSRAWEVSGDTVPLNPVGGVHYKLYMNDVGLFREKAGIPWDAVYDRSERTSRVRGALAETFVLTELKRSMGGGGDLHYWKNEKGRAEVDFVVTVGLHNIPIEVKFDDFGRIRGMELYCERYSPELATVISRRNVRSPEGGRWMLLPLYLAWRFPEYADAALKGGGTDRIMTS